VANFTIEQVVAVASIQQLINDWAYDLDVHEGLHIASLVTEDCNYTVRAVPRIGRAAVEAFYKERLATLSGQPGGAPTQRHMLSNLRVDFRSDVEASITFSLLYFSTLGIAAGTDHADPAAVSDVRMDVRRDADGEWRIAKFDSGMTFKRTPPAAPAPAR
jgi:ketosteroid isomerase-like protein